MILSEQEKNRIRKLHKKHSVIKEQANPAMQITFISCNGNHAPITLPIHVTLDGQELTQNDVGKAVQFPAPNIGTHGTIESISPTTATWTQDVTESPCPPPPIPAAGIMFQMCGPGSQGTVPYQLNANVTLDGQALLSLPNNGVGTEITFPQSSPQMYGTIDSIFITTNPNTNFNAVSAPCPPIPPPALGFMMGGCPYTYTNPFPMDANMTLDGVPLANVPNYGVGTEISFPQMPGVNGVIDSVFMSTNPNSTFDVVSTPCPPPPITPIGIRLDTCGPGATGSMDIVADVYIDGQRIGEMTAPHGVGTDVYDNQANPPIHGTISTLLYVPPTTSNVQDFTSGPCPQTQTMWKCQTQGQPCVQDPTGTYNDEATCNTNCTLPQFEGPCDEFRRWPKRDQKDFCSNCVGRDMEPMCECCVDMGLI
ncbi:hypothetical protein CL614_08030 [archaeon]|nr:hypothetical protein [archaeon]